MRNLTRLYDLNLTALAAHYNLSKKQERIRSVNDLEITFFQLAGTLQPACFIEAGANDARVSIIARRHVPDAHIVAFEASPHNYSRFALTPKLASSVIDYRHVALGIASNEVKFHVKKSVEGREVSLKNGDNSLLKRSDVHAEYEEVVVPGGRLDELFKDVRSAFLWIDVVGATGLLLEGASGILHAVQSLLIEVEDREYWVGQWLYKDVLSYLYKAGFIPVLRDFQSRYQYNVLFLREDLLDIDRVRHFLAMHHSRIAQE